jgi:hypothetical protein
MLQRSLPTRVIAPCLPTKTDKLPPGDGWLHEIKHDGFRIIARKTGAQVRLYSRPGCLFAAMRMSPIGTSRQFAATQHFGRFRGEADI